MGQQRRQHSPEFKADAVALVRSSGRSIAAIARELGIGASSLGYWLKQDEVGRRTRDPERFATESAESAENRALRRRVAETSYGLLGEGVARVRVFAFVAAQKADFPVRTLCRVCRVSTSGFHAYAARKASSPSPGELARAEVARHVARVHKSSRRRYGSPRVTAQLAREGILVNHKAVEAEMARPGPSRPFEPAQDAHDAP